MFDSVFQVMLLLIVFVAVASHCCPVCLPGTNCNLEIVTPTLARVVDTKEIIWTLGIEVMRGTIPCFYFDGVLDQTSETPCRSTKAGEFDGTPDGVSVNFATQEVSPMPQVLFGAPWEHVSFQVDAGDNACDLYEAKVTIPMDKMKSICNTTEVSSLSGDKYTRMECSPTFALVAPAQGTFKWQTNEIKKVFINRLAFVNEGGETDYVIMAVQKKQSMCFHYISVQFILRSDLECTFVAAQLGSNDLAGFVLRHYEFLNNECNVYFEGTRATVDGYSGTLEYSASFYGPTVSTNMEFDESYKTVDNCEAVFQVMEIPSKYWIGNQLSTITKFESMIFPESRFFVVFVYDDLDSATWKFASYDLPILKTKLASGVEEIAPLNTYTVWDRTNDPVATSTLDPSIDKSKLFLIFEVQLGQDYKLLLDGEVLISIEADVDSIPVKREVPMRIKVGVTAIGPIGEPVVIVDPRLNVAVVVGWSLAGVLALCVLFAVTLAGVVGLILFKKRKKGKGSVEMENVQK